MEIRISSPNVWGWKKVEAVRDGKVIDSMIARDSNEVWKLTRLFHRKYS